MLTGTPTAAEVEAAAKARGWKIRDLCYKAKIAEPTFYRWKSGRSSISVSKLDRLIDTINSHENREAA